MSIPYTDPSWYIEQFKQYKIMPERGHAKVYAGATCAIGIAHVSVGLESGGGETYNKFLGKSGMSGNFMRGLVNGFDGIPYTLVESQLWYMNDREREEVVAGYQVGQQVWQLAVQEFPQLAVVEE